MHEDVRQQGLLRDVAENTHWKARGATPKHSYEGDAILLLATTYFDRCKLNITKKA